MHDVCRKQPRLPVQEEGVELTGLLRDNPEREEVEDFRDQHSPPIQETNSEEYSDSGLHGSEVNPLHSQAGDKNLVGAAPKAVLQCIASTSD